MTIRVDVDNFIQAETARMFDGTLGITGGTNRWAHFRAPTPLDAQSVIRMNRDTLYSGMIADISGGATLTLPEASGRYMTVMAVNQNHHVNRVFSSPGSYELTVDEIGTPYVSLAARTFVDPGDPTDVAGVNALQDGLAVEPHSSVPYTHPDYDEESLNATRDALLLLARGLPNSDRMFGRADQVDPVRHLIGTAFAWGGLPETEAYYYVESQPRASGSHTMVLNDVPVDAFWSVAVYNRAGFFEENPYDAYSINSVTADTAEDGSVVVHFSPDRNGLSNHLYVMDGWNYALRLYKPRSSVLDKTWTPPKPEPRG